MIQTFKFETESSAHDYMCRQADVNGNTLASGVGNNMQTPFYLREGAYSYLWHPNGVRGNIIRIVFSKNHRDERN